MQNKKASVRRQIQDKSYWMALLNAKMNELNQEIGRLNRATEQMKNNESKVTLMQAAATSLAKELSGTFRVKLNPIDFSL